MEKAYLFLQKLIALGLNVLIFFAVDAYIPFYYSIPVLLIVFALIISRISNTSPKELYNFHRSEKYFAKGGLRDLIRIPVGLFAFIHDIVVWALWGVYQILIIFTEIIYFIKVVLYWIIHAFIWFLKLLVPFWRLVYHLLLFYLIKWPWWIYRYAFNAIKKTYNWNILKVSFIGAFFALFIFQLFYTFAISWDIIGFNLIGIILALLPVTWVFGEIASIRGQKLLYVPFSEVRFKFRNGLESVRGILFFMAVFVVLFLAEAGLSALGWFGNAGVILLGIAININFVFNLVLIILAFLIVYGSIILPSFRLYNEFNETSFPNVYNLLKHAVKRSLQYFLGFIPAFFFGAIAIVPITVFVALALWITMQVKEYITIVKIEKLVTEQAYATNQIEDYKIGKEIDRLEYVAAFPKQFFQDINHRTLLKKEKIDKEKRRNQNDQNYANQQEITRKEIARLNEIINTEQNKDVINQTRLEEHRVILQRTEEKFKRYKANHNNEQEMLSIDIQYLDKQYKSLPVLVYLSGLFVVIAGSFIFAFILAYFGNYFYRTYLFRNDGTPAQWRIFIAEEREYDHNQPLLSTTLNTIIILVLLYLAIHYQLINYLFS
jgi:hypothetical protein